MLVKKTILAIIFILTVQQNYCQNATVGLDKESFLLATLSDYLGRMVKSDQKDKIDDFEKPMADAITSLFKTEYTDYKTEVNIEPRYKTETIAIYSQTLSKKINSNFTFERYALTYPKKDTIYYGSLKSGLLITELQKISFIVGLYSQFGVENKMRYCIRLSNSVRKFNEAEKALKELGCKHVEVEVIKNIPTQFILYFEPTIQLEKHLREYSWLRKEMQVESEKRFKLYTKHAAKK